MTRFASDCTVTDVFCGAGGNTIGAKRAGLRVRVGLNHWDRAIETYGANNRDVDVIERVDVSLCDPRRYPTTDIGIFSPECTTHSPAGGSRHARQPDLFDQRPLDPGTVRSRVTMFDVVRFTEYHQYRVVIVENVVEATRWVLFPNWLRMMDDLGYRHRLLSLNSMFFHPTPQSRDRIYVAFWRKGNRAPDLEYRPPAPCARCGDVAAVQAWKPGRTIGKYRRQYAYHCPRCAGEVTPYYYAALNALDFSLAAERIGDRRRALRPRTMERIRFGLERYGRRPILVRTNMTSGVGCRVRGLEAPHFTQTASWLESIVQPAPFLVSEQMSRRVYAADEPIATQTANRVHDGVAIPPGFLVETAQTNSERRRPRGLGEPLPTIGTQLTSALVSPFIVGCAHTSRDSSRVAGVDGALSTVHAGGGNHAVIQGAAQISMRDTDAMRVAGLERELLTQGCAPQQAIISRAPFIVSYYGSGGESSPVDAPVPTVLTLDHHGVVGPAAEMRAEDSYFRMLQPHEIGAAMAFPGDYEVTGNKRDRAKQYGNAVTPPVMDWIVQQCAATLAPELEGRVV